MVLTHSDREVVSLQEETEMLKLYIELEALRFEDTFSYKIDIHPGVDIADNKVPTLLIQPFVENAIWHGLLHKEGKRKLDINFSMNQDEELVCTIEDNGIGREAAKAFAKRSSQNGGHTGKGLSVANERLEIFNQQNGDSSSLKIEDVKDEKGNPAGTKVTITLPDLS
jgi:sensor histidine kinase YesM